MEITEEQRQRAEANRLAALAKRKNALSEAATKHDVWKLFKCRKVSPDRSTIFPTAKHPSSTDPFPNSHMPEKFRVRLEICSPDSFSVTPDAVEGFPYPGEAACLEKLSDCLSNVMLSHYTQYHGGGKACVYKLVDYDAVLRCLKNYKAVEIEEIPWVTFNVLRRLSHSFAKGCWLPCRPEHLSDEKVDELIRKLPQTLLDTLLPFQLEGVRFGLQRGGRCLIADEMGLGKTLQAIAIAYCFMSEGPILVVCPAILRFSWADELERWLPFCMPADIHLVFGHQSNPALLTRCPRVVVISFTMLNRLRRSMLEREWALMIVDESHHVRCTKKTSEPGEIKAVLDLATKVNRIVLLSGTPSLSRPFDIFHQINMLWPGLLGRDKYEFARTYCSVKFIRGFQGKVFQDFSRGTRLEELNVLLKQTVMIRRLKKHVLVQLPPKRRQIINLQLKRSDIITAMSVCRVGKNDTIASDDAEEEPLEVSDEPDDSHGCCNLRILSEQEISIAKLSGFYEWLSIHPIFVESNSAANMELGLSSHKMIIFGHHHKVLDRVQEFVCDKGIEFVRIDGRTPPRDRQLAVRSFQSSKEIKIAIIGIMAACVGLDFSSAQHVVFLELPQDPSHLLQAEDRAHRRGQTKAVNIYIFCAKDTLDESRWQYLNKSLHRVSSTTNGKYGTIHEIEVESVSYLETTEASENPTFEGVTWSKAPGVDLRSFPNSDSGQDLLPVDEHNEMSEVKSKRTEEQNETGGNSSHEENFHAEADVASDLDMWKHTFASEGLEENASEVKTGCSEIVSLHNLEEYSENKDGLEKEDKLISERFAETIEDNSSGSIQVECLRFEVSQYTGRIHLYSCIPGIDSRPRPLFENFRPEELELPNLPANNDITVYKTIKDNPVYRDALLAFVNEWNNLRPIQRSSLLAKPLQLPLSIELCYLKESLNHDTGGLLKGRSKRRTTPLNEISHALPSNAVWKKVHLRSGYGKKEKEYTQGWTATGKPLCKLCQTPCESNNAKTPEFLEDLFCNLSCYEEYRLRTSNRFLRQELFQIEQGICTNCQLDCHKLVAYIRPLSYAMRQKHIEKAAPKLAKRKKLLEKLVRDPTEGNAWHADHIVPIYEGGGECRLENMRTLCVVCHAEVTAAQCAQRRSTRIKAKKKLKVVMDHLRNIQKAEQIDSKLKDEGDQEITVEEELLINVPGSAYSRETVLSKGMTSPPTPVT